MSSGNFTNTGILLLKLISRLPFRVIYLISDFLFLNVYYLFRYRKKVVEENLRNSFPGKSEKELKIIARKFYRHFCDLTLETIKMYGMNEKDYNERVTIKNPELVNRHYEKGRSVVVVTMHYNNWEWSNCFALQIHHTILGVYRPLHNKKFDEFINQSRAKTGSELVPDSQVFRRVISASKTGEKVFAWLAADQTPPGNAKFWTVFLNQETPFYSGPEKIANYGNYPVIFHYTRKVKRGRYEIEFIPLFDDPKGMNPEEIQLGYIRKMEDLIRKAPEFYLWSHRRWKHIRPENIPLTT